MLALSSSLPRTGLALKIRQIKLATRSYLRDRVVRDDDDESEDRCR